MSWYQVTCLAVASEEVDNCNHQNTPQECTNAADQHWVLKQGQDLWQIPSLAVWLRGTTHLWVWEANRKKVKSAMRSWWLLFFNVVHLTLRIEIPFYPCTVLIQKWAATFSWNETVCSLMTNPWGSLSIPTPAPLTAAMVSQYRFPGLSVDISRLCWSLFTVQFWYCCCSDSTHHTWVQKQQGSLMFLSYSYSSAAVQFKILTNRHFKGLCFLGVFLVLKTYSNFHS